MGATVVIAKSDVKLRHLARNPQCVLVAFEAVRPFRGVKARGVAELVEGDVTSARVAALEHAWTTIRRHHLEVPEVVIVVASGSDPRSRRLNLGHFAAGRWQLTDQPTDRPEVLVSGEGLQRGPVDVLGTLLHEAAHGLAFARKVSDTAAKAATTTAATPPSPKSSAWTSPI